MPTAVRFYLDENVPVAVAGQLQLHGIEAVTVRGLGVRGDSDESHLARATQMGYVLCSYDTDFVALAKSGVSHAGIVIGRRRKHATGDWVKGLERLHAVLSAEEMRNRVEYL